MPSLVPLFEEMQAARFSGYTWASFRDLSHDERVMCVAHYRADKMIRMHTDDALQSAIKAQQKKSRRKGT